MGNYLSEGGIFVIQTLFGLLVMLLNLRFIMQASKANYYNPIAQGIVKATNPLIGPFRMIFPIMGPFDLANMACALVIQSIGIVLIMVFAGALPIDLIYFAWAVIAILASIINLYFFALLISVIASWLAPYSSHPALELVQDITDPLCRPARRLIPAIGGLDFSIIVVFLGLSLLENSILIRPLAALTGMPRGLIFGF